EACTLVTAWRPGFERPDLGYLGEWLTPPQIETIAAHVLETPLIAITATDIRGRVRSGRSPRYLSPAAVAEYIGRRRLYADS
ncbi:MAG: nicotinic acid mononucleotide adenylyltransferase, partial [Planctomycetes bacterium]|nr:nicotinic acid mononucleotide adenylyltransferase [Planctomycetota bacterium]